MTVMGWNAIDRRFVRLDPWDNSGLRLRMRGVTLEERAVEEELRRLARERATSARGRRRRR
ncbi:MAG TPA: hypothetical protein VNO79_02340 [Actinomycetota bacterium]|nr:hypothetical protein [Actinomycetota bacterium]